MNASRQHHVFGPVPSRRLGRSLGVDLVPFKTCTYDCIYCQLGRTTCKTVAEHRAFTAPAEAQASVEAILALLRRRPCTVEGVAHGLGIKPGEAVKLVAHLETQGGILTERRGQEWFYRAARFGRKTPSFNKEPA